MDYPPHVAGEAILRWIVLVVGAHPVPSTVSVAWICGPHQSARSAAQAHLNMDTFAQTLYLSSMVETGTPYEDKEMLVCLSISSSLFLLLLNKTLKS